MTNPVPPSSPAPSPPRNPPGPRTLADEMDAIPPDGTPEAVRIEDRHRAARHGGIDDGKPPED